MGKFVNALLLTLCLGGAACEPNRSSRHAATAPAPDVPTSCDTVVSAEILAHAAAEVEAAIDEHASIAAFRAFIDAQADELVLARDLEYGAYAWQVTQWTYVAARQNRSVSLGFPGHVSATGEYSGVGIRILITGLPDDYEYVTYAGSSLDDPRETLVTFGEFSYSEYRRSSAEFERRTRHATPLGYRSHDEVSGDAAGETAKLEVSLDGNTFGLAATQDTKASTSSGYLQWNDRTFRWTGESQDYCRPTVEAFLALQPDGYRLLVPGDDESGPLWLKAFPEPWF